jgi:glycosyltransferase involved in cell wall biosynthesis
MLVFAAFGTLVLAALPAVLTYRNLRLFGTAPNVAELTSSDPRSEALHSVEPRCEAKAVAVSVLIPARNEQASIAAALEAVLQSDSGSLEVMVLDDHSTDATAGIVAEFASRDSRVRLIQSAELPADWNGKQHACWQLANAAHYDKLIFLDADVRLKQAAIPRILAEMDRADAALISGFPSQRTETLGEQLLIPMMYVVLLGYLPLDQMRRTNKPAFGAGCGQLFAATRGDYFRAGGHRAIKGSRHDGVKLPRSFRQAGFKTDLFDASDLAEVRMYRGWGEVARGLLKNANEGIANARLIVPFTTLLVGQSMAPLGLWLTMLSWGGGWLAHGVVALATVTSFLPRLWIARRFQHPWWTVPAYPVSIILFLGLQWVAFLRNLTGRKAIAWRERR